jgi:hypothetical protein
MMNKSATIVRLEDYKATKPYSKSSPVISKTSSTSISSSSWFDVAIKLDTDGKVQSWVSGTDLHEEVNRKKVIYALQQAINQLKAM